MDRENEQKKEYLRGYRKHARRVARIEAEIEELRSMKMNPSMNNDGMPHGNGQGDLSGYITAIDEKEEKLYQEGIKRAEIYKEIQWKINSLSNEDERDVLFYRYIKGKNWWEIAQLMDYSERQIYRIHGNALEHIKISKDVSPCQ